MNKSVVIGIILAIIIVAIIAGTSLSFKTNDNSDVKDTKVNEPVSIEDTVTKPEKTGREFSVELTESVGLKSP